MIAQDTACTRDFSEEAPCQAGLRKIPCAANRLAKARVIYETCELAVQNGRIIMALRLLKSDQRKLIHEPRNLRLSAALVGAR